MYQSAGFNQTILVVDPITSFDIQSFDLFFIFISISFYQSINFFQ